MEKNVQMVPIALMINNILMDLNNVSHAIAPVPNTVTRMEKPDAEIANKVTINQDLNVSLIVVLVNSLIMLQENAMIVTKIVMENV